MLSQHWHENLFVAISDGPPPLQFYIWQEPPEGGAEDPTSRGGWCFTVSEMDGAGEEKLLREVWEPSLEAILRCPQEYARREITWRRCGTDEVIDLYSLKN